MVLGLALLSQGTSVCMIPKGVKKFEKKMSKDTVAAARFVLEKEKKDAPKLGDNDDFILQLPRDNFLTQLPHDIRRQSFNHLEYYRDAASVATTSKTLYHYWKYDNPYGKMYLTGHWLWQTGYSLDQTALNKSRPQINSKTKPVDRGSVNMCTNNGGNYARENHRDYSQYEPGPNSQKCIVQ